jgi:hypothetical protein
MSVFNFHVSTYLDENQTHASLEDFSGYVAFRCCVEGEWVGYSINAAVFTEGATRRSMVRAGVDEDFGYTFNVRDGMEARL